MRITELVESERPRERLFANGADALSNTELLAILLGSGSQGESATQLAGRLLKEHSLSGLQDLNTGELRAIKGIGNAKAARLIAAFVLQRRVQITRSPAKITDARTAAAYCTPIIGHLAQEHFLVVFLDVRLQVRAHEIITKGLADNALIHPREVFHHALRHNAHAILLAHNHPSGDPTPSDEDVAVTKVMQQAGTLVGIQVIDHLVIAKEKWESANGE